MDPIDQLIKEHQNIMRGVSLLEKTAIYYEKDEILEKEIYELIRFFKGYADAGHHAKEEALLFKILIEKDPSLSSEFSPLSVLTNQHVEGRALVGNLSTINKQYPFYVSDYASLLTKHIEMEDELFPELVTSNLTKRELTQLGLDFLQEENKIDTIGLLKILDVVDISL